MKRSRLLLLSIVLLAMLILLGPIWVFPSLQNKLNDRVMELHAYQALPSVELEWHGRKAYLNVPDNTETALLLDAKSAIMSISGVSNVEISYLEDQSSDDASVEPVEEAVEVEVAITEPEPVEENVDDVDEKDETETPSENQVIVDESLVGFDKTDAIAFGYNTAELTDASREVLQAYAPKLAAMGEINIIVIGHTDSLGDETENMALSIARAQAVVDELILGGISEARVTAVGKGESEPVATNDHEEGRKSNRRVEITRGEN